MTVQVEDLSADGRGVALSVAGRRLHLSWTWLRDHARDPSSFHAAGHQRLVSPAAVGAAGPATVSIVDDALVVEWPGGPRAHYPVELLGSVAEPAHMYGRPAPGAWTAASLEPRLTRAPFGAVVDGRGFDDVLDGFARDGVALVLDVPVDLDATRRVLERFGYVRSTIFGGVWQYGADGGYDDTASTTLEITPHTDGTYSHDAPGLLALHCHRFDATGGDNLLVDGAAVASTLAVEDPDAHQLLRTVDIPGQYVGDGVHLVARRPVLRYEGDRFVQVSYNHHDRAPFLLDEPEMNRLYDALGRFDELVNRPDLGFQLALRPGDMLLIDNWRLLHGRRAFSGDRWMAGGYVNREDVDSAIRLRTNRHPDVTSAGRA